jgi:trk system potassium uptake protein TrkA
MYVVVAGGGHMGTHLVERLVEEGHEAVVIDTDPRVTERLFAERGVVVFTGSATDISVLDQSGIRRADVAVAMTGRDSDNLSFCLLARYYGVPRVMARMLDPKYEVPYRLVGASSVHNESEILVRSFLNAIDFPEVASLMPIGRGDLVAIEVSVPPGAQVAGLSVAEIARREDFPRGSVFIGVESASGTVEVPTGATVVSGGSRLIAAAHRPDLRALVGCVTGRRPSAASAEEDELLQTLNLVRFLSGMSQEDLRDLAAGARVERRKAGELLFQAGAKGDRIYVLKRGEVELLKPGGRRVLLRPPAHFGELAALTGDAHADTARVIQAAELVALESAAFRSLLLRNPFLALEVANSLSEPPALREG